MASNLAWKRWHEVVQLRGELKTGDLPLNIFAADLYDVVMGRARPIYQQPAEFFAFTYPTFNLRELAKDVILRLAGRNDKAVRQLELTYGGGKTHTLITLYHLTHQPQELPDIPTVREFIEHITMRPPQARIAVLPFDKLDVEKGMEVVSPAGERRTLEYPWSILAFQLAGSEGLRLLHRTGAAEERDTPPAENVLVELLSLPDLPVLILIDEVLMYARQKVGQNIEHALFWRNRLVDFFQCLTQAATKVPDCAMVVSLLATDPRKSDELGKDLIQELSAVLRREREESIQPVGKEDVAEVLRRRFFTPESIRDRTAFRAHALNALQGIAALDEETKRNIREVEERFVKSYPFHPDLTDIFFSKWTNLEGFQRTRGILRTFALALRDAETWDKCPLIAANVFIGEPERKRVELSEAARELTTVAETEVYGGQRQDWSAILEGELAKARAIQAEQPALHFREVEQAVFATFLHSQPIGMQSDASTHELLVLIGHTRPDRIEIEKALHRWTELSWFLDEASLQNVTNSFGAWQLPRSWRLGLRPNLRQIHYHACKNLSDEAVESYLINAIRSSKILIKDASASGAHVHMLPARPADIDDDGEFHFAILSPAAASREGRPSEEAIRFLTEKSGPDSPRVYRNAVVLAVPSIDGIETVRNAVRTFLGWQEVEEYLQGQDMDVSRRAMLKSEKESAERRVKELVSVAYNIVVTISKENEVQAFKVVFTGEKPLFSVIKADEKSRIAETAVNVEALLPGGPYNLWREGETAHRLKDLVEAFAQFAQLPKMLNRQAILQTLLDGCKQGLFVFRLPRPEHTFRTFWRELPEDPILRDPALEVVLPEAAVLDSIPTSVLLPGALPELWHGSELRLQELYDYFADGRVIRVERQGPGGFNYDEYITIPRAGRSVVDAALQEAVRTKQLWLICGRSSFLGEEIPAGMLTPEAVVQLPPPPIAVTGVLPDSLAEAWPEGRTTALAIADTLSAKAGKPLPWLIVRDALEGAFRARMLERTLDSGPWPCDYAGARAVSIALPQVPQAPAPLPPPEPREPTIVHDAGPRPLITGDFLDIGEIQNLNDQLAELTKATVGLDLQLFVRIELHAAKGQTITQETRDRVNALLAEVSPKLRL